MRYNVHKIKHRNHILSITKIVLFLLFIFSFVMLATQILKVRHEQNAFLSLATLVSETEQDFLLNKTNDNISNRTFGQGPQNGHFDKIEIQDNRIYQIFMK